MGLWVGLPAYEGLCHVAGERRVLTRDKHVQKLGEMAEGTAWRMCRCCGFYSLGHRSLPSTLCRCSPGIRLVSSKPEKWVWFYQLGMKKVSWTPRDPSQGCDRAHGSCDWTGTVGTGRGGCASGGADALRKSGGAGGCMWTLGSCQNGGACRDAVTQALGLEEIRPGPEVLPPVCSACTSFGCREPGIAVWSLALWMVGVRDCCPASGTFL